MQQMNEAAGGDLQAEPRPQQAGDLGQRHAHLGVQLDDERGEAGTELHRGRPERVGYLEAVPPLHALAALRAAADLDVEAAHDGAHPGEFFLILRGDAGHFDGAAAVGTRRRRRRPVGLVRPSAGNVGNLAGRTAPRAVGRAAYLSLAAGPWQRGAACRLPARRASSSCFLRSSLRRFQRSRSRVVRSRSRVVRSRSRVVRSRSRVVRSRSPGGAVQVAGGAVQIVDQLGVLPLKLLDALVPRILLSPGRPRTVAPAVLAGHAPCIGTCAPTLHTTSRIFSTLPANQRRHDGTRVGAVSDGLDAPPAFLLVRRWHIPRNGPRTLWRQVKTLCLENHGSARMPSSQGPPCAKRGVCVGARCCRWGAPRTQGPPR